MNSRRFKRITNELAISSTKNVDENGNVEFHLTDYIKMKIVDDNLTEMKAEINGPLDSQYQGRIFELLITFPENYPFRAPDVKFITEISHPDIDAETGTICADFYKGWTSNMVVGSILMSIYCLLGSPSDANIDKDSNESSENADKYPVDFISDILSLMEDPLD